MLRALGTDQHYWCLSSRLRVIFRLFLVSAMLQRQLMLDTKYTSEASLMFKGGRYTPPAHTTSAIRTHKDEWPARIAGLLLSANCIQSALCSWRLQYFPSGRGELASLGLRKVTLVSELVRVQSQLCLETTHVPFPLLYDCSVNFQVNLCKLLSSWNSHTTLTFIGHSPWSLPGSVAAKVLPLRRARRLTLSSLHVPP